MKTLIFVVILATLTYAKRSPPAWSSTYSVKGFLTIPFAEIMEEFEAYFDEESGNSRIDYYNGMDKTFQLTKDGAYGRMLKIVPITDEKVFNQMNCFAVSGDKNGPIEVQSILPDLSGFELKGTDYFKGQDVQKWQKKEEIGHKLNKYTMYLKVFPNENGGKVAIPVHYEMKGFNTLTGSHYDHYYLEYMQFNPQKPDPAVFADYDDSKCHGFPGPGFDHTYTMNPMREFISHQRSHVDDAFDHFQTKHGKNYRNNDDRENRKDMFSHNMRFIHSKNRQHLGYKLEANHLTDLTDSEMARMRGRLRSSGYNGGDAFSYSQYERDSTPQMLDWRLYGAVSPVKDQASCGSCWSFGTVSNFFE